MIKIENKYLCIVGDIHGELPGLVSKIWDKGISDTAFILAGDCGFGFCKAGFYTREYDRIKRKLEKLNSTIYCVRGNHDDPEYYNGPEENRINFPRLKTLPDYTRLTWEDREILVIGGGTSIDQEWRIRRMKRYPSKNKIWWPGENIIQDLGALKNKEDIIISHDAPLHIGPVLSRPEGVSLEVYQKSREDREYLGKVLKETNPARWIFGHHHCSTSGDWCETLWKGLDINEIYEIR